MKLTPYRGIRAGAAAFAFCLSVVFVPSEPLAAAVPPVPLQLTPRCDAVNIGKCYNQASFTLSASSPGADHYRVCRSNDTLGWGGCNKTIVHNTGPIYTVDGVDLPADGFRRAYYWSACDSANQCTLWKDSPRVYIYRDSTSPTTESIETPSTWVVDEGIHYTLTVTAVDSGSGVGEVRTGINLPATGGIEPRGLFDWLESKHRFSDDQVTCVGGGFASKRPNYFRPATVTLVGCSTSLSGDQRTVNFELRPNPTFGAMASFDISLRAWDAVGTGSAWQRFDVGVASTRPHDTKGKSIGYSGILDQAGLSQAMTEGMPINIATLLYQRKECSAFYWRDVDTAGILAAYRPQNVKSMVILENFLFRDINDSQGDDCLPLEPPPPLDPSTCFNNQKWRLLPDWQARLDEFVTIHGPALDPADVAFFLLSSEVNDRCFDLAEVEAVALAVRDRFPGFPLAMIYGATHGTGGQVPKPAPSFFPPVFDVIGVFSYEMFNVNDPLEARNATTNYYDPQQPEDPNTVYGDLLTKLHPHQEVMLVFDANFNSQKQNLGWVPEDLGTVARNYADFMTYRPEVTILGGFFWQGLLALPQEARDEHRALACEAFDNSSPLCLAP